MSEAHLGKVSSLETRLKISEALRLRKGMPRPGGVGQKRSEETRKRMSEAAKKRGPISEETRKKMSVSGRARLHPGTTEETKKKISNAKKGRPIGGEGQRIAYANGARKPLHHLKGKRGKYSGIIFRSSWEVALARFLDDNDIIWQYEPSVFDLGYATYRPDFLLPEYSKWIEVKGYWSPVSKEKVEAFRGLGYDIEVLMKPELEDLGILLR